MTDQLKPGDIVRYHRGDSAFPDHEGSIGIVVQAPILPQVKPQEERARVQWILGRAVEWHDDTTYCYAPQQYSVLELLHAE